MTSKKARELLKSTYDSANKYCTKYGEFVAHTQLEQDAFCYMLETMQACAEIIDDMSRYDIQSEA